MTKSVALGRPAPRALGVIAVLLTFASGASDVASFTRLGNVFTSVMTGNMAVFGLSLARGSLSLALHTLLAVCGYVLGVGTGIRLVWFRAQPGTVPSTGGGARSGDGWPPRLRLTLLAECVLYTGVVIGWELTGSRPAGVAQYVLLVIAACGMGIQSAATNEMGLGNVSTTYLTGTLTGLVSAIARRNGQPVGWRRQSVLLGLLAGAALCGLCIANTPAFAPLLPLAAVSAATAILGAYG
ncbi:MAG: YoaK family protein [Trebonia sp.]